MAQQCHFKTTMQKLYNLHSAHTQDTLLHLAAKTKGMVVLPLVSEEYKRLKVFADAILKLNKVNKSPLHIAIEVSLYDNVTQLFKDCLDLCPKALEPLKNGKAMPTLIFFFCFLDVKKLIDQGATHGTH